MFSGTKLVRSAVIPTLSTAPAGWTPLLCNSRRSCGQPLPSCLLPNGAAPNAADGVASACVCWLHAWCPYVWWLHQTTDLRGLSEAWVVAARKYLSDMEDYQRKIVRMLGPKTKGTATLARAAQLMQQHGDLRELLQATIRLPPERCECCCCCRNGIAHWWCRRRRHHCRPQLCCP